jgi:RHS repeat-associated protein
LTNVTFAANTAGEWWQQGSPQVVYDGGSSGTVEYSTLRGLAINSGANVWLANNDFSLASVSLNGSPAATVYLENNWWGSNDPAAIEARITDHADNTALPRADYTPWLWLPGISSNVAGFDVLEASPADNRGFNSIDEASAFLDAASSSVGDIVVRHTSPTVNFKDPEAPDDGGGTWGLFPGTRVPFAINNMTAQGQVNGNDDRFAIRATGTLRIAAEGDYSFGVQSDDGFSLRIAGAQFTGVRGSGQIVNGALVFTGITANSNTIGHIHLTPGDYAVTLDWFENWGNAFVELSWAPGLREGWDGSFVLLGQPVTVNPPPVPRFYVTALWPESGKATDFVDVTFNDHADHADNDYADLTHFTPQDVTLVGPSGPIEVTIEYVERSVYRIRYPYTALVNGATYHLTIGPNVQDEDGRRMDQNLNGVFGEADDTYTATFTADLTPPRVVSTVPAGDVAGTVNYVDVIFSKPIDPATFTLSDVQFTSGYTAGPGLLHGVFPGAFNTMDPNPATDIQPGILAARGTAGAAWSDNTTQVYTGEILVGASGTLAFAENFDDSVLLKIDGITWLNNSIWNEPTASGTIAGLTPGWHTFELRLGQGVGGVGPTGPWGNWGVGYDPDGSAGFSTNQADYQEMMDDGTMNLFRALSVPTVAKVTDTRFRISFAAQTVLGQHVMTIGPDIRDLVGNSMDQNRNGVRGEASDAYTATFNLVDVDLELSNLNVAAAELWAGDPVHVSWSGANRTGYELLGEWTDAVYLSKDDTWDLGDTLLTTVRHTSGLPANTPYSAAADVTIPGVLPGDYRILVRADMYGQEKEAGRKGNNVVASAPLPLGIRALATNGTPLSGSFGIRASHGQYFMVNAEPGQSLLLKLDVPLHTDNPIVPGSSIVVTKGRIPGAGQYEVGDVYSAGDRRIVDYVGVPPSSVQEEHHIELLIPATYDGATYYISVADTPVLSPAPFTLSARPGSVLLKEVNPSRFGRQAPITLDFVGNGFSDNTTVELIATDGTAIPITDTNVISDTELTATVNAPALDGGSYDVRVSKSGFSYTLAYPLTVIPGVGPRLEAKLVVPSSVRTRGAQTGWIEYKNTGDAPMPAPLFRVSTAGTAYITTDPDLRTNPTWPPPGATDTVTAWATPNWWSGHDALPGTLQPGESGYITFYYLGVESSAADVPYALATVTADSTEEIDWASIKNDARPEWIAADAWDAMWSAFTAQMGATWGDFVGTRAEIVNYLQGVGEEAAEMSMDEILAFAIVQASQAGPGPVLASAVDAYSTAPGIPLVFGRVCSQSPEARYRVGTLGYGWSHNWDYSVQTLSSGDALIRGPGASDRLFAKGVTTGTFTALPGDYGTLTQAGGLYRLRETGGTIYQFRPDGMVDYVEDANGNRVTCGYSSGRLMSLTHSNGDQLLIDYTPQGSIWHVTDPLGPGMADDRVTTFSYDASGTYLLSVTAPGNRVSTYTYQTTGGAPVLHSLLSVGYPDGRHSCFGYDPYGRVSDTYVDGGEEHVTYAYPSLGVVTAMDAAGVTTTIRAGSDTQPNRIEVPGSAVRVQNDASGDPTQVIGPEGQLSRFSYDARGNLTGLVDPSRGSTRFTYEPTYNEPSSLTDARGNGIDYSYDAKGNLTSITYEDGTHEDFTYDSAGNCLSWTNRRGETVTYTYDVAGELLTKDYDTTPGVTDYVYTYDAAGNLTSATDASGTTTVAYQPNTDWLERIDYPGGKWFTFEYDAAGRRTKRTDQDGNVENYGYDTQGRLDRMTDGTGAVIVDYDYDAAGRLVRKTLGNGVYTTYEYDAASQLTHLVNRKADGTVLSRFDYTYNASGQRTSMAMLQGTWNYGYDASGQLTKVTYPDGHVATYVYDAVGNRAVVTDSGEATAYVTNSMNQYITVGDVTYTHDADGNMTSKTEGGVRTAYTYDIENRLVKVEECPIGQPPTDVWQYTCDGFGNRVASAHNGVTTNYVIDPIGLGDLAAEYDATGNLIARYNHGYGLVSRFDSLGSGAYYTFSAIGNTSELTNAAGTVLNYYSYDPFGVSLGKSESSPNPFEFVGEHGVMSETNGLQFMRARYYDPVTGRFGQCDPSRALVGSNSYSYAANRPSVFVDPSGRCSIGEPITDDQETALEVFTVFGSDKAKWSRKFPINIISRYGNWGGADWSGGAPCQPDKVGDPDCPATDWLDEWWKIHDLGVYVDEPNITQRVKDLANREAYLRELQMRGELTEEQERALEQILKEKHELLNDLIARAKAKTAAEASSTVIRSYDPNDKIAPSGFGGAEYVQAGTALSYRVNFENQAQASAPAQRIVVTDVLDSDLDLSTFQLTEIAFANHVITVPAGLDSYKTSVDLNPEGKNVVVDIDVSLDPATRTLTATLTALDPTTGWLPEEVMLGLLYPDDNTGRGEGHLSYLVSPKAGLDSGTRIENQASIVFDWNDPVDTPKVLNTLDGAAPASRVAPLPPVTANLELPVFWSGEDEAGGSGLASFDVYVSDNGGEYRPWLTATTATSATFPGEDGHTYDFYTVARDNVGHIEAVPAQPDASTIARTLPRIVGVELNDRPGHSVSTIDPSGVGIRTVKVTFSEPATFDASDVVVETVEFDGNAETVTATLTSFSVEGSGTNVMTLTFDSTVVADTWVKMTLKASGIADLAANALDGEAQPAGSRRQYIFSPTLDLPTGDGVAGGDAVFYVGSLRGDFSGDGLVGAEDVDAFLAKFGAADLDADLRGESFGPSGPDGLVTPADLDAFVSAYNVAVAEGWHLDPLPNPGPQSEGGAEPLAIEGAPTSVVVDGAAAQPPEPEALLWVDAAEPALSDYPTPLAPETDVLALTSHAYAGAPVALASNEAEPEEAREVAVPQISAAAVGSSMVPVVGLIEAGAVPLAFGAAQEVASSRPEPVLEPDGGIVDLLALPALALCGPSLDLWPAPRSCARGDSCGALMPRRGMTLEHGGHGATEIDGYEQRERGVESRSLSFGLRCWPKFVAQSRLGNHQPAQPVQQRLWTLNWFRSSRQDRAG